MRLAPLQHRGVPNQNEIRRPDRGISQNPRVRRGKLCPFRRHSPQYIHQFTHAAGRSNAFEKQTKHPLCGQITALKAMLKVPRWAYWRVAMRRPKFWATPCPWSPPIARWVPSSITSRRGRGENLSADECELWPVSPVDGLKGGRKGRKDRYKAYTDRAKACFPTGWHKAPRRTNQLLLKLGT